MRRCYGFEEVAIVPGDVTVNPEQTDIDLKLGNLTFSVPILAAAMDAVVDPKFAVAFSKLGGLAVLNLEGVQARYEKPEEVLAEIAHLLRGAKLLAVGLLTQSTKLLTGLLDGRAIGLRRTKADALLLLRRREGLLVILL